MDGEEGDGKGDGRRGKWVMGGEEGKGRRMGDGSGEKG